MQLYRTFADAKLTRDPFVGQTGCREYRNLLLAAGKPNAHWFTSSEVIGPSRTVSGS
jgi:hypothetical protein